jgi:hypothetical protein
MDQKAAMKNKHVTVLLCAGLLAGMAALPAVAATDAVLAETLTYREIEGDAVATHVLTIIPEPPGFRIELGTSRPGKVVRQTFRVAADLTTREWTFSDPARRLELAAVVRGEDIVLSGSFQGKKVEKRFDADGAPWNQLFQMGLGLFALSGRGKMQFRSIGTEGPGELKIGKMTVTRQDDEAIALHGEKVVAVHLRISLSGLLSIFWHGDYWYRRSDGRFLRYRGKNRSGGPVAVSELVREEPGAAN